MRLQLFHHLPQFLSAPRGLPHQEPPDDMPFGAGSQVPLALLSQGTRNVTPGALPRCPRFQPADRFVQACVRDLQALAVITQACLGIHFIRLVRHATALAGDPALGAVALVIRYVVATCRALAAGKNSPRHAPPPGPTVKSVMIRFRASFWFSGIGLSLPGSPPGFLLFDTARALARSPLKGWLRSLR